MTDTTEADLYAFCRTEPLEATASDLRLASQARGGAHDAQGWQVPLYRWGPDTSDQPAVLLLHGWRSRATHLGAFARTLARRGRVVVSLDWPGHGEATARPGTDPRQASGSLWTATLRDTLPALQALAGVPVQQVIGHSMGALVAGLASVPTVHAHLPTAHFTHLAALAAPWRLADLTDLWCARHGLSPARRLALYDRLHQGVGQPIEHWDLLHQRDHLPANLLIAHDPADDEASWTTANWLRMLRPDTTWVDAPGCGHGGVLIDRAVLRAVVGFVGG